MLHQHLGHPNCMSDMCHVGQFGPHGHLKAFCITFWCSPLIITLVLFFVDKPSSVMTAACKPLWFTHWALLFNYHHYYFMWLIRIKNCIQNQQISISSADSKGQLRTASLTNNKKLTHTRLPSVGFWNWSLFLAVSLQVTWVINPAVGCHYFPPGPQSPSQPLRGLLPVSLLGEQRQDGCEQFA